MSFSKINYSVSLIIILLFLISCSSSTKQSGLCNNNPDWYTEKNCPKGYLCGYGNAVSDQALAPEFLAENNAKNNLSKLLVQTISKKINQACLNIDADALKLAFNNLFNEDQFAIAIEEIANNSSYIKDEAKCDGRDHCWIQARKDIADIDYKYIFEKAINDSSLSQSEKKLLKDVNSEDWIINTLKIGNS